MTMSKKYWKGLSELENSESFVKSANNEFAESLPLESLLSDDQSNTAGTSRRDFLKLMGFSTAAVALVACETPVNKVIPYVVKPEEITPGIANYYATTFYDGHDYASILVKTREGRPIKIEGNELSKLTYGGTSARVQASVLGLYDNARLTGPVHNGQTTTWNKVDGIISNSLKKRGTNVILTSTIISPSTQAIINDFITRFANTKHITYDAISYSALLKANETVFGKKAIASYNFSKANVIVGISCDFLGTWLNPIEFANQYSKTRKVNRENLKMSKHYHFESNLSLTGANADERYMVKPSEYGAVIVALYNEIASNLGFSKVASSTINDKSVLANIQKVAKDLCKHKGNSLVICGYNDYNMQVLVNGINHMLQNYTQTIDINKNYNLKKGDDADLIWLTKQLNANQINTLITYNTNPVYTAPASLQFEAAYKKANIRVSLSQTLDETSLLATVVCPDHHYLESWGDANPKAGSFSLQQPTINPIFAAPRYEGTRQAQNSLLTWANIKTDYYSYLKTYWNYNVFTLQGKYSNFQTFWNQSLHDGVVNINPIYKTNEESNVLDIATGTLLVKDVKALDLKVDEMVSDSTTFFSKDSKKDINPSKKSVKKSIGKAFIELPIISDFYSFASKMNSGSKSEFELLVYEKVGMGNGTQSNNPWLQELPDPISKVTWDNYITMNPDDVAKLGLNEMKRQDIIASIAELSINGLTVKVPVYPQPGQAKGTIGLAVGYGRNIESMKVAHQVGVNAYAFTTVSNNTIQNINLDIKVTPTSETYKIAATQIHHTIMGREEQILREVSLNEYKTLPKEAFNPIAAIPAHGGGKQAIGEVDLWDEHERLNHKWGLTIDMTSCIGCAACVVACTVENNVHVVGKEEVAKTRDMHWLRIDRYYTSDMTKVKAHEEHIGAKSMYLEMENPSLNPKVTFQPIMCQHCNHAPCETVCPVLATSHSTEGLNMMTYNRCIGTRYCANNCPFKVRRFNWFNYIDNKDFANVNPAQQDLGRMVLNPDVVVRTRGVMEKCSMCQHRLQAGKVAAKKAGTPLKDGSIKTACQQACPTNAIMFGDVNDKQANITTWRNDDKNYELLAEIGIKPTVSYLLKVRNQEESMIHEEHAAPTAKEQHSNKHA